MATLVLLKSLIFATALKKDKKRKRTDINIHHRLLNKKGIHKCRICNEAKASIPIFDNEWKRKIAEEIRRFSGVVIANNDRHPKHICQQCLDLLNSCIRFREICQRTQKLLNVPLVHKTIDAEPDDKIDNSESDNGNNKDDSGDSSGDDFSALLSAQDISRTLDNQGKDQKKQTCKECFQDYVDKQSFNWHLPFCEARFEDKKKPIKKEASNKCFIEDKSTEKKVKLTYLCDTCGKICVNKHVLAQHMTTHTNIFPFKCDECPYRGRTFDLLRTHKRTHLAVKPYKCDLCPKTTTTCSNLRRHIMTRHKQPNSNVKCTYCDKSFTNKINMKKHITNIHQRQASVHECDICFRKYSSQKLLRGHRIKVHNMTPALMGRMPDYLLHQMAEERGSEQHVMDGDMGEE